MARRSNCSYLSLPAIAAVVLLLLGIGLRFFDLTDEPIDFHPTRQLRGAIVARGIYYDLLPNAEESIRQQAESFRRSTGQYEPPILESLVAITYLLIGREAFWIARIYNTLFWTIGGIALFFLARLISSASIPKCLLQGTQTIGMISASLALVYYLVLPFSVQASRSFQPDPGMVVWVLCASLGYYQWSTQERWKWAILAGVASGLAILTKAVAFYPIFSTLLAVLVYKLIHRENAKISELFINIIRNRQLWVIVILAITPVVLSSLGKQSRAEEYFSTWTIALSHLLLQPRFYLRWINLAQELLSPLALLIAFIGILLARGRNLALLLGLWTGYFIYGLTLPYQMDTHSYYHLQLVPLSAISMSPVFGRIVAQIYYSRPLVRVVASLGTIVIILFMSWQAIIPLYQEDYRGEPAYWREIASYLPSDSKTIALTQDYGFRLMYYGWRKVTLWPNRGEIKLSVLRNSAKDFDEYFAKKTSDKGYFLITAFRQFDDQPELKSILNENYPIKIQGQGYIVFDLQQTISETSSP